MKGKSSVKAIGLGAALLSKLYFQVGYKLEVVKVDFDIINHEVYFKVSKIGMVKIERCRLLRIIVVKLRELLITSSKEAPLFLILGFSWLRSW